MLCDAVKAGSEFMFAQFRYQMGMDFSGLSRLDSNFRVRSNSTEVNSLSNSLA